MALHDHRTAQPSRRSVLGAAAWSVPAIALVSASPAYATSGNDADPISLPDPTSPPSPAPALLSQTASGSWANNWRMSAKITVANTGGSPAQNTVLTVVLPNAYMWLATGSNATPRIRVDTSGWSASPISATGSGSGRQGVFTLSSATDLAAGTNRTVEFTVITGLRLFGRFTDAITVSSAATGTTTTSINFRPSER